MFLDGIKVYTFTVKGNIIDYDGKPVSGASLGIFNVVAHGEKADAKFIGNSTSTNANGDYELPIYIKAGEEKRAYLTFSTTCSNAVHMLTPTEIKFSGPNDFNDIGDKGEVVIKQDLVIQPVGCLLLQFDIPQNIKAEVSYKTKNLQTKKIETTVVGTFEGKFNGYGNPIKSLPNEKLEVIIKIKKDNNAVKEVVKEYIIAKSHIKIETLNKEDLE